MALFYSKLTPLVDLVENNEDCVILRVKPYMQSELVKLPGFYGDEQQFRLTKPRHRVVPLGSISTAADYFSVLTIWPSKEQHELAWIPRDTDMPDIQLLGCVCVDYGIPLFTGDGVRTTYLGEDISNVWDKYISDKQILSMFFNADKTTTVYLNDYPIYRAILNQPDAYYGLMERLPLLHNDNNAYVSWFSECVADKLSVLTDPTRQEQLVRVVDTVERVKLSDIVDKELLDEYIANCGTACNKAEVRVGGMFSINVEKNTKDTNYVISVSRSDKDLGTVAIADTIHVPFSELQYPPSLSAIEPIKVVSK